MGVDGRIEKIRINKVFYLSWAIKSENFQYQSLSKLKHSFRDLLDLYHETEKL